MRWRYGSPIAQLTHENECEHSIPGQVVLTYDLYSVSTNDPNFDPIADLISKGNQIGTFGEVDVVPEPGSLLLLLSAVGVALLPVVFRPGRAD